MLGLQPLIYDDRLMYSPSNGILILECPRSIHEIPLSNFRDSVSSVLRNLPYDRYTLHAGVKMNLPFQSPQDGYTATPDLRLYLTSLLAPEVPEIPVLVECGFSQD
ncbi:hypothetical protein JVT61DRAFT_10347 [Boletus reticuloceps]|uniref:Uncharacterized protein n=1 Tax=Boletus reticuloceps TaxID=495285 RepID=A0A8I2YZ41_9AGAM|nr:hypothetical protein JVT61DRAFT_10347 [Boletus reticuloceps]